MFCVHKVSFILVTNPPNDLDIIKVAQILSVKLGSATGSDTKWEEFGMRLLQTTSRDDVWLIDPDRSLFLRDKYKGLLNHWKSGKQDPKWDDVIKVLKEMKLVGLATALQKALGTTDHGNCSMLIIFRSKGMGGGPAASYKSRVRLYKSL